MTRPTIEHPVVVGVDESAQSRAAALWAAREALLRDVPLHLVHAWNWSPNPPASEADATGQRRRAHALVQATARQVTSVIRSTHVTTETVPGPATAALLRIAERAGALVLGSRGLGALSGLLVGSVAGGVVGRAACPVVLVREAAVERADEGREVVLGLDLDDPCDDVIDFAFASAWRHGARLHVVSAWHGPHLLSVGPGEVALAEGPLRAQEWEGFQEAVLRTWQDKYLDVEVTRTVAEGRAQALLLMAASGADLVVVGRRCYPEPHLGAHAGPVTHAVIHHAACPVAVVPHD
ncbi:universal stress protein [Streptomyces sp. NPDC102467]|uniref:universal stress protein n=1 Tax=Streptomyces sp. NPDC102467 TaxID=3366179 RepID=UPI00380F4258